MGTSRGSFRARVTVGSMMGSCSYHGQKQLVSLKIFQPTAAPLKRQCRKLKSRQDQPSQDWIARNSRQDRELDTDGSEVIPTITAMINPRTPAFMNMISCHSLCRGDLSTHLRRNRQACTLEERSIIRPRYFLNFIHLLSHPGNSEYFVPLASCR